MRKEPNGRSGRKTTFPFSTKGQNGQSYYRTLALLPVLLLAILAGAQQKESTLPVQQVRGTVSEGILGASIEGATVFLSDLNRTVKTDAKGNFRFTDVPVGVHRILVSFVGYKEGALENINVISGKETVLSISLQPDVKASDAVVVKANSRRNKPLNEMSAVSARAFTVEETQKYAAAVNDPSRMAMSFPGVVAAEDGNNTIIIRGNSPTGLLWRMEGVDIPNPNHFSSTGSSGGGISILSSQLLANSDFVTGAFASEYGNALSGVFDLKLRRGNNEKKEYTLQAGLLGLNAAAEGPLMPFYGGSYLVNYRYSTLQLLNRIGVPIEIGATNFQDLSYNFYLPTRKLGTFTWFGFGGLSNQKDKGRFDSTKWESRSDRYRSKFISNTGATGITHNILLGGKTSLRSALAFSYNRIVDNYEYIEDDYTLHDEYIDNYKTRKWTLSSTLNRKLSARSTLRGGVILSFIGFDYFEKSKENENAPIREVINSKDATQTVQAFGQWQYRPVERLTLSAGLHYLELLYNHTYSLEPRASAKYQLNRSNSLAFGFGQHSQVQPYGVYFAEVKDGSGAIRYPNRDLDLTRARHYVLSYQHAFSRNLSLKAEAYYQQLFNVPVSAYDTSSFSLLNIQSEYVTDPLVNQGKGRNYGLELSLERYLDRAFYYTLTTTLYQSKYTAHDGVERNTRFNGNYIATLVTGKEFLSANRLRTFGINIRTLYSGGLRTTPVNLSRSLQEGHAVYYEDRAFSHKNPDYFRTDLRLSLKWNRKRLTSTLSLDLQNVTNRLNVYGQYFDSEKGEIVTSYQNGLIPILNYKVEF